MFRTVSFGSMLFTDAFQFCHEPFSKGHEIISVLQGWIVKKFHNPASGIGTAGMFQSGNDTFQTGDIFIHPFF